VLRLKTRSKHPRMSHRSPIRRPMYLFGIGLRQTIENGGSSDFG
jgi:hypothetical protein